MVIGVKRQRTRFLNVIVVVFIIIAPYGFELLSCNHESLIQVVLQLPVWLNSYLPLPWGRELGRGPVVRYASHPPLTSPKGRENKKQMPLHYGISTARLLAPSINSIELRDAG